MNPWVVQIFYTSNVHHFLAALAFTYKASWLHHIQVWCWTVWQYTSFCALDGTTGDTQAPDKEADSHAPAPDSRHKASAQKLNHTLLQTSPLLAFGVTEVLVQYMGQEHQIVNLYTWIILSTKHRKTLEKDSILQKKALKKSDFNGNGVNPSKSLDRFTLMHCCLVWYGLVCIAATTAWSSWI